MFFTKALVLSLAAVVLAHPGHEMEEYHKAVKARDTHVANKRALEKCAAQLQARGVSERAVERRRALMEKERQARGISVSAPIKKRDTASVLATDHKGTVDATSAAADSSLVFTDDTCTVLNPEGEIGPFYVLGEYVRSNLIDDQEGVSVVTDIQFIDVTTCEPLADVWADVWNANATGVYGGVQSSGNGNGDDASNLDKTFLRGIQQADSDGVVQFTTLFPGHYSGRTNHIHVVVHDGSEELANGTISGGSVSHIGQLFWDQSLIDEVEEVSPYNTNTNSITTNAEDSVLGEQETEDSDSDPVFNYVYFNGEDVTDGLFTWIQIGVNASATYDDAVSYSFELTSSGGVTV